MRTTRQAPDQSNLAWAVSKLMRLPVQDADRDAGAPKMP